MFTTDPIIDIQFNNDNTNVGTSTNTVASTCNYVSTDIRSYLETDNLTFSESISSIGSFSGWFKFSSLADVTFFNELFKLQDGSYYSNNKLIDILPILNVFHHFVVINSSDIYINKVLVGSSPYSSFSFTNMITGTGTGTGTVKALRVFDYTISFGDVQNLFIMDYLDPIMWYPLNNGDLSDYSHKNKVDVSLYGDYTLAPTEVVLETTSIHGAISIPDGPYSISTSLPLTISFKLTYNIETVPYEYEKFYLGFDNNSTTYGVTTYNVAPDKLGIFTTAGVTPEESGNSLSVHGQQYHIVFQQCGDMIKLYVDNNLIINAVSSYWNQWGYQKKFTTLGNYFRREASRSGGYSDLRVYNELVDPANLVVNSNLKSTANLQLIGTNYIMYEQIVDLRAEFDALNSTEPPVAGVTDTDYLEAQDVLPLFNDREVYFGN
ncbi:MAG: hypothetical protein U9O94_08755 [Nanoarchaeota archaeon]|nr:hypothetical protein [Nanoarchaeota archaeon]